MSDHTPAPWMVSSAICGKHRTETVSIYHYPHEAACYEVVETGCKCGDEALTEANARHIVHCVNNHEKLVDMVAELDELVCYYHGCFPLDRVTEKQRRLNDTMVKARALLAELEMKS